MKPTQCGAWAGQFTFLGFSLFIFIYVKQEDWGISTLTRTRYSCTFHLRNFLMFNSGTKANQTDSSRSRSTPDLQVNWCADGSGDHWGVLLLVQGASWALEPNPYSQKNQDLESLWEGTPQSTGPRAHSTCAVCCQWWTRWEIRPSNRPGGLLFAEMQVGKGQLHSFYFGIF